jgi:hypothetical protein
MIFSNTSRVYDPLSSVEGGTSQSRKAYRKELKRSRQKAGDAASGEFQGPWAIYEGMEQFKSQQAAELNDD